MASVVHLVLRDGSSSGVVVGTQDNWTGKAIALGSTDLDRVRSELNTAGVYVLVGVDEASGDGTLVAYIGEAESLADRLRPGHAQFARQDVNWQRIVVFLSQAGDLHKAHVKWLESKLVSRARVASRWPLTNGPAPALLRLPEHDAVFVQSFYDNMLAMYPLLGVDAFELASQPITTRSRPNATATPRSHLPTEVPPIDIAPDHDVLVLRRGGQVVARARMTRGGYTLLPGSRVSASGTGTEGANVARLRDLLLENGKLVPGESGWLVLTDEHEIRSASAAAKLVVGSSVNGLTAWQDADD